MHSSWQMARSSTAASLVVALVDWKTGAAGSSRGKQARLAVLRSQVAVPPMTSSATSSGAWPCAPVLWGSARCGRWRRQCQDGSRAAVVPTALLPVGMGVAPGPLLRLAFVSAGRPARGARSGGVGALLTRAPPWTSARLAARPSAAGGALRALYTAPQLCNPMMQFEPTPERVSNGRLAPHDGHTR